jgi:hypothetical protein
VCVCVCVCVCLSVVRPAISSNAVSSALLKSELRSTPPSPPFPLHCRCDESVEWRFKFDGDWGNGEIHVAGT